VAAPGITACRHVGGLPEGVERDDPLPPHPPMPLRPFRAAFPYTLARIPAVANRGCGRSTTRGYRPARTPTRARPGGARGR